MAGRKQGEVPARLSRLEQRFAKWRKTRVKGERIPERLWKSAAKVAADCGLNQTAKTVKLDYYTLKRRMDELSSTPAPVATFIELPPNPIAQSVNECIIELEDGAGASMRMHWKGDQIPDLLALGRSFWSTE